MKAVTSWHHDFLGFPWLDSSSVSICQDHFNVEEDMENYARFNIQGGNKRLKPHVVPHIFDCQADWHTALSSNPRPVASKRAHTQAVLEAMEAPQTCNDLMPMASIENIASTHELESVVTTYSTGVQVHLRHHVRSKSTQCTLQEIDLVSTSKCNKAVQVHSFVENDIMDMTTACHDDHHIDSTSSSEDDGLNNADMSSDDSFELSALKKETSSKLVKLYQYNSQLYLGVPEDSLFLLKCLQERTGLPHSYILLTLKKIRINRTFEELSDEFDLSKGSVSKIFKKTVQHLSNLMQQLILWPSKQKIKELLPLAFRTNYSDVSSIIDCFEIEIEKPTDAVNQALTWSEYKKCNTLKYLVAMIPNGVVAFVSSGFGGRTSHTIIFKECGILDKIPPGTTIMADRGFKTC